MYILYIYIPICKIIFTYSKEYFFISVHELMNGVVIEDTWFGPCFTALPVRGSRPAPDSAGCTAIRLQHSSPDLHSDGQSRQLLRNQ